MARGRMISQSVAEDIEFNDMSCEAKLIFLMTVPHLDRDGLIHGHPAILIGKVAPLMMDLLPKLPEIVCEWEKADLVIPYADKRTQVLFFKGFSKHQSGMRYERESPSTFEPPPGYIRTGAGLIKASDRSSDDDKDGGGDDKPKDPPNEESSATLPEQVRQDSGNSTPEVEVKDQIKDQVKEGEKDLDEINAAGQSPEAEPMPPQTDELPGLDDWPPKKPTVTKPNAMGKTTSTTKLHRVSKTRQGEKGLFDPRKLKGGRVPAGTGATPCEILFEFVPYEPRRMSVSTLERVHYEATDLEKWRNTLTEVDGRGWSLYNISDRLQVYQEGFKYQNGAANGKSKSSLHKNGATQNGSAKVNPLYAQFG